MPKVRKSSKKKRKRKVRKSLRMTMAPELTLLRSRMKMSEILMTSEFFVKYERDRKSVV